jgi:DNA topoisomerase VI subunit B
MKTELNKMLFSFKGNLNTRLPSKPLLSPELKPLNSMVPMNPPMIKPHSSRLSQEELKSLLKFKTTSKLLPKYLNSELLSNFFNKLLNPTDPYGLTQEEQSTDLMNSLLNSTPCLETLSPASLKTKTLPKLPMKSLFNK